MEKQDGMATGLTTDASASNRAVGAHFVLSALWSLFGAVVSRGLTLMASVLAGRLLGTAGFGEVGMIQSTQGLFGVLAGAGLGLAATKYVAEYRSTDALKAGRCVTLAMMIAASLGVVAGGVLMVFSAEIAEAVLARPHLANELRVATGLILFGALAGVQTGALIGLGEFRVVAMLGIVRGACLFVSLLLGIWLAGVMGGIIGLVFTEGVAVIANQLALRRHFPHLWSDWRGSGITWPELSAMCRFGGLAVAGSLCTTLAVWFSNVVLVNQPEGFSALGIFNAAERWRQALLFLPAAVAPVVLPMLSNLQGRNDPAGYRKIVGLNLAVSMAAVLAPTVGVMVFARLAMSAFGTEYQEGSLTLVVLAASAVASVLNTFLGQILVSKGAIWWRFALDVLLGGVLALVSWRLIPEYRDLGLAYGNLAAYGVTALGLVLPVLYYMKRGVDDIDPV